jgi:hypothetical protein
VTLMPLLVAVEIAAIHEGTLRERIAAVSRHAARFLPFVLLLIGYLAIEYIVNSRSYLVREGHYSFGWHAIPNVLNYIVWLYVGKRIVLSYLLIVAATALMLVKGSWRLRFFVLWIFVTLTPVSFFTWGNASRYLYVPAAGFAMLLAELLLAAHAWATLRWRSKPLVHAVTIAVAIAVTVRFALFANDGADAFRNRTRPYERFAAEVRRLHGESPASDVVSIAPAALEGIPELYRDPAAATVLCKPGIRVSVR